MTHDNELKGHDELLTAFQQNRPQARPAFQQSLEDDLLARLQEKQSMPVRKPKDHNPLPLTLAAAIVAVLMIGGLLLVIGGLEVPLFASQSTETEEAPPPEAEHIPVIIAAEPILLGTIITEEMVYQVFFPQEVAEDILTRAVLSDGYDGVWIYSDMNEVLGKQATTLISPFHPIERDAIETATPCDGSLCAVLPADMVAISLPIATDNADGYLAGARVDVYASMLYVDIPDGTAPEDVENIGFSDENPPQVLSNLILEDALVIDVVATDTSSDSTIVTLAVAPQDAVNVTFMVDANMPLTFALKAPYINYLPTGD